MAEQKVFYSTFEAWNIFCWEIKFSWALFFQNWKTVSTYSIYCVKEKTLRERKETTGRTNKGSAQSNTPEWKYNRGKTSSNTKQSFLSSCLQPASLAAIKAFNQIIRRKHQKDLGGSTNSSLYITPHITTLYYTERVLILMNTYVKIHYKPQYTSFLSPLPARICEYEQLPEGKKESCLLLFQCERKVVEWYDSIAGKMVCWTIRKHGIHSEELEASSYFIVKDTRLLNLRVRKAEEVE